MAASTVARICDKKSCVRARTSRNVHITVLNQKITKKVTAQPIITQTNPDIAPRPPLDGGEAARARKTIDLFTGQTPLSEERFNRPHQQDTIMAHSLF